MSGPLTCATLRLVLALAVASPALAQVPAENAVPERKPFTRDFMLENCDFASRGANPFFILEPGYRLILEGTEDGEQIGLVITVLDRTRQIGDVETRVVVERETVDGELVEVSRNYFAICRQTNSVVYFGEDVDIYEDGQIVSHEGAWRAGIDGAKPGLIMPGTLLLGARYFQEIAPGTALDRAEILSLDAVVKTPIGTFKNCLKTEETTPLEPGDREFKLYAPGVGLLQDGSAQLVQALFVGEE